MNLWFPANFHNTIEAFRHDIHAYGEKEAAGVIRPMPRSLQELLGLRSRYAEDVMYSLLRFDRSSK